MSKRKTQKDFEKELLEKRNGEYKGNREIYKIKR